MRASTACWLEASAKMALALAGDDAPAIVERLRRQPKLPLAMYYDGPSHRRR